MDDLFSIYIHITIGSIVGILLLIFIIYRVRKWLRNTKETRAEKKRLKKEEKDLRKQEKIEKKQLKLQEKIKKKKEKEIAKQLKIKEKEDKKKEKSEAKYEVIKEKARSILTKTFSKEYKLVPRDTEKKPQRTRLWMALIILIIALVGIAFYIKNQLTQYFMYFILGLAIAVALFLLVSLGIHLRRKRLMNKVEQKDLSNLRKEVKEEISVTHNLISKEALKRFKEKRSRKSISTVVILLIIAGVSFAIKDMISEFPYLIVSGVAVGLAVLVIILKIIKSKIKSKKFKEIEFGTLQTNKSEVVAVNWKKGLGEFLFRVKNKVESALLSVKLWKNQQVFITPEEKVYQFFEVKKVNIEDKDLDKVSFRFKVKKAWLRRNKIAHEKVSLLRYTTNKWVKQQKLDIINETRNFVFYEAVHSSFSHFAIVGKEMSIKMPAYNKEISSLEKQLKRQKKKTTRKQSYFNMPTVSFSGINKQMIGIILIALAVIWAGMYMVFLVPGTTTTTAADNSLNEITKDVEQLTNEIAGIDTAGGIPAQVTQENQQLSINLGKYFSDPDGDSLTYANSPVEYFTITYEGSTAFITPKPNWAGEEVVVFTATDAKGSSVDSNPVTVKVNEDPNKIKMPQFLKDYGWNLLLGFAVLAIIIALVESRKRMFDE